MRYDLSSSYFEGEHCPLAARGYSRDGKKGKWQVNYGLLTNARGCPVAISAFKGNTSDPQTLLGQVDKLQQDFNIDSVILVGDRGMISQKQIEALREYYKDLAHVESAFRTLKSDDLKVRPIYHHTEERVRAHLFLGMLAYSVKWHMSEAWRALLFADEDQARTAGPDPVAPATRSEDARVKVATKALADGSPAHSFRTLLNELATIVRNTCRRKNADDSAEVFDLDTRPNPKQLAAFDLLKRIRV